MTERDIRFSSWVVSLTSIMYGIFSIVIALNMDEGVFLQDGIYGYAYYLLYLMLIVSGIAKIIAIIIANKLMRKVSIVVLMFVWGFVWTSNLIEFTLSNPNRDIVLVLPIIAICGYIAVRGDYQ